MNQIHRQQTKTVAPNSGSEIPKSQKRERLVRPAVQGKLIDDGVSSDDVSRGHFIKHPVRILGDPTGGVEANEGVLDEDVGSRHSVANGEGVYGSAVGEAVEPGRGLEHERVGVGVGEGAEAAREEGGRGGGVRRRGSGPGGGCLTVKMILERRGSAGRRCGQSRGGQGWVGRGGGGMSEARRLRVLGRRQEGVDGIEEWKRWSGCGSASCGGWRSRGGGGRCIS
ncbi:uncharacterized protein A4U43_C07F6550 [Asparagus officinalis]|uniref:Uncharacterized protein n=1 Tax=Asparagus officinalis TaxID=4686 RepID=A0A5P1ED74_ASPOF|nr:uncharacterized protein A4U43_C07F6550 [Asparagus officinalis]